MGVLNSKSNNTYQPQLALHHWAINTSMVNTNHKLQITILKITNYNLQHL
jgi:hypothetical protein